MLDWPGAAPLSSLTLSPDELELVYSAGSAGTNVQGFFHTRRASKADVFPAPVALPELDAACATAEQTRSGDLTFDGLRFYFTCYLSSEVTPTPLRVARRASLDAPFVLDPTPLGNVIDERSENEMPPDPSVEAKMRALIDEMTKAGVVHASGALASTKKGARIRFDGAKSTVLDGPFAESKELVAGYAMLELPSKAAAIDWAIRFGEIVRVNEVEVRQVVEQG